MSLPVVVLNSPAVSDASLGGSNPNPTFGTARDVVGIALWAVGFVIETVADAQKVRRQIFIWHLMLGVTVKLKVLVSAVLQVE